MPTADTTTPAAALDETVVLPAEAFFVRRVPLDPAAEVAEQVELALETHAPFGAAQLFHGYLRAADGATALIFATHRRLFAAEAWDGAAAVLPAFVALLAEPPNGHTIRVWSDGSSLAVLGWDGTGSLPAVVLARKIEAATEASERAALFAELKNRLGELGATQEFVGPISVSSVKDGWQFSVARRAGVPLVSRYAEAEVQAMDVRDKTVLAERRATQQRDRLLWRVLVGAFGCIALAGLLELGSFLGGILLRQQREAQAVLAPAVEKIQTAQTLGTRIDEMAQRRLRAFEMLAVINSVRPSGLTFNRSATSGRDTIEIEGQAPNADNVGVFESAVRLLPQLASVEMSGVGVRDGMTNFRLTAVFKDGTLAAVSGTDNGGAK